MLHTHTRQPHQASAAQHLDRLSCLRPSALLTTSVRSGHCRSRQNVEKRAIQCSGALSASATASTPNKLRLLRPTIPNAPPPAATLVYFSGTDGTGQAITPQLPGLAAAGFDVRCLYIPVSDRSDWGQLTQQATGLLRELVQSVPHNQVTLVGESFGGALALRVAALAPDLIERMVLVNPATCFGDSLGGLSSLVAATNLLSIFPEPLYQTAQAVLVPFLVDRQRVAPATTQAVRAMMLMSGPPSFQDAVGNAKAQGFAGAAQQLEVEAQGGRYMPSATANWRLNLLRSGGLTDLQIAGVRTPTLLIASAADRLLPSLKEARRLSALLRNSQRVTLPDSGHTALLEEDVALTAILARADFLPQGVSASDAADSLGALAATSLRSLPQSASDSLSESITSSLYAPPAPTVSAAAAQTAVAEQLSRNGSAAASSSNGSVDYNGAGQNGALNGSSRAVTATAPQLVPDVQEGSADSRSSTNGSSGNGAAGSSAVASTATATASSNGIAATQNGSAANGTNDTEASRLSVQRDSPGSGGASSPEQVEARWAQSQLTALAAAERSARKAADTAETAAAAAMEDVPAPASTFASEARTNGASAALTEPQTGKARTKTRSAKGGRAPWAQPDKAVEDAIQQLALWRDIVSPSVSGTENLPDPLQASQASRPLLFVGNHSRFGLYDLVLLIVELYVRGIHVKGLADPRHWLGPLGEVFQSFGAVKAGPWATARLMRDREALLLFPGGGREVQKRRGEEYQLFWREDRADFVRLAAKYDAIIIPFAAVGADDAYNLFLDTEELLAAPVVGPLARRVVQTLDPELDPEETLLPVATLPGLPIPSPFPIPDVRKRLYFRFFESVDTKSISPTDAAACNKIYAEVRATVEQGMATLRAERPSDPGASLGARLRTLVQRVVPALDLTAQTGR